MRGGEGAARPLSFFMRYDMLKLLEMDNNIEEFWKMATQTEKLNNDEMADLIACVDMAITNAERSGARKDVLPGVAKAYMQRAETLKMLRSKVMLKP